MIRLTWFRADRSASVCVSGFGRTRALSLPGLHARYAGAAWRAARDSGPLAPWRRICGAAPQTDEEGLHPWHGGAARGSSWAFVFWRLG